MSDKTVVITGGSKGIGLSITESFLAAGFNVYVGARHEGDLKNLTHPKLKFLRADVRIESDVDKLITNAVNQSGRLDVLVNNAGYSEWRPIEAIDQEFLSNILATNLMSAFWGCKAAVSNMTEGGSIINISSIAGKRGSANNSAYVASKFGMNGLTQALAKEVGHKNIRVNGVCPVLIPTNGLLEALESPYAPAQSSGIDFIKKFAQDQSALKRLPSGGDVAAMCLFLASDASSAITGQNINVDCGVFPQ
jgi:3-oxoacyl-[acyl-carrier protein] reductase/meso-butanediol dehydrogenase/(S,S)-butanediol dehydrogenase/diacetyl reductase